MLIDSIKYIGAGTVYTILCLLHSSFALCVSVYAFKKQGFKLACLVFLIFIIGYLTQYVFGFALIDALYKK